MRPMRGGGGTPRAAWSSRWRRVSSLVWVNSPSLATEVALADRAELGADGAPGLAGAGLGDTDDHQGEEADQDVGADAVVLAVEDGSQPQDALEVAEGAFGFEQLLVAERDVLGREARVRGGEQVLAVQALLGGDLLAVEREQPRLGLAQVAGEGRVVAQRALAALVRSRSVLLFARWRCAASRSSSASMRVRCAARGALGRARPRRGCGRR